MTMPVYAITGASGHAGRYAVHQLLARNALLAALRHRPRLSGEDHCSSRCGKEGRL
jgi:NAD(P)-dependent dehydrogenase (short-subunit alcohol dehydrogenase family)